MNRDDAEEFRNNWLQQKNDSFIERKVYKKGWARVEDTMGEFKPLSKIVIDEGGWDDREAVHGALTLAMKCLAMGQPWVMRNPQTGRLMFVHLKFS